jgi:hypothetical protein
MVSNSSLFHFSNAITSTLSSCTECSAVKQPKQFKPERESINVLKNFKLNLVNPANHPTMPKHQCKRRGQQKALIL